ncbi:Ferric reduction oxidase 6 [Glycine soja]|uniref:ferric reduction oxidase 6 isoform X1 n=1 Tax=Glycine max TaxID=3847 RepID=UPI001B35527B|nr:ferric reduction oxidase 6 isoform X1 [Glycine max]
MEKNSLDYSPLLSPRGDENGSETTASPLVSATKWTLKTLILMIFVLWAAFIFFLPAKPVNELFSKWNDLNRDTPFGVTGSIFLVFTAPILIIAFLAIAHQILTGEDQLHEYVISSNLPFCAQHFIIIIARFSITVTVSTQSLILREIVVTDRFLKPGIIVYVEYFVFDLEFDGRKKTSKLPRFRLWTFPVFVKGPFGVVSATELIGIVLVLLYVIWALYAYTVRALDFISEFDVPSFRDKSIIMFKVMGLRTGAIGLMCLAFLFIPVSRGSVLLRYIDIPFEHATRYHVWLGHLTMVLFTVHGLLYVIAWAMEGHLVQELIQWKDIGVANLPGVISLLAGLLMWVTSLPGVRTWNFELFFYTHQLYVVFVVFLALHVGDFVFTMAAGGIFFFVLDRFLRFCQSRRTVNVISSRCLPCGTVELVLSKPQSLRYNALSFIFVQVRELSWLQWHPFSVSSSPLDGKNHLAVLIKVLGKWTEKLRQRITDVDAQKDSCVITTSVEGPYGHEVPYHLMYENLILVAGGIGLSPFLAILSDILHRVREGKPCQPRNILLVWAVKKSNELPLLSTIDMESICPSFSNKVNIDIHIYVTRESDPPLEEGYSYKPIKSSFCPMASDCGMSVLVGTGDNFWSGLYVISSTVGFVILLALLYVYYVTPFHIETWWYRGLLYVICMVASVVIFGGSVVAMWHIWEKQNSLKDKSNDTKVDKIHQNGSLATKDQSQDSSIAKSTVIHYGSRPNFKEIYDSISEKWGLVDVGVIVCGPSTLQTSVAEEIRSHSMTRQRHHSIFHFHSHSFDL